MFLLGLVGGFGLTDTPIQMNLFDMGEINDGGIEL